MNNRKIEIFGKRYNLDAQRALRAFTAMGAAALALVGVGVAIDKNNDAPEAPTSITCDTNPRIVPDGMGFDDATGVTITGEEIFNVRSLTTLEINGSEIPEISEMEMMTIKGHLARGESYSAAKEMAEIVNPEGSPAGEMVNVLNCKAE